jgi:hypothetical protein
VIENFYLEVGKRFLEYQPFFLTYII